MKKYLITTFIILLVFLTAKVMFAQENLSQKLSGRILLQVESHGEAWYVYPDDNKKYYLGRPKDAFDLMRNLGLGATHEFITAYTIYPNHVLGKILLDVEQNGEAYYIYPKDKKAYYLGRPSDAFNIMRVLSLGITNANLNQITTGYYTVPTPTSPILPTPPTCTSCQAKNPDAVFNAAASAIRSGNKSAAVSYFILEMQKAIEYTMDFLDDEGKFILGNIMSGAKLSDSTDTEKIYSAEIHFALGGYKVIVDFHVKKQDDETWKLTNL